MGSSYRHDLCHVQGETTNSSEHLCCLSTILLLDQTEETPEELNHRLIMLPDQPIKLRWDVAISLVCVLVAMLTPYRMAFAHNDAKSWLVFDAAVDVLFVIGKIRLFNGGGGGLWRFFMPNS